MEKPEFKVGDIVVYINNTSKVLLNGQKYVIKCISEDGCICQLTDNVRKYFTSSFVLFEEGDLVQGKRVPELHEIMLKQKHSGICSFAFEYENGKTRFVPDAPCHAELGYKRNETGCTKLYLHVERHTKEFRFDLEQYKRAITYIIKESPWAHCFLPCDIDDVMKSGVYIDVTQDADACVCAAIALRTCSEDYECLPLFCKLLDMGVDSSVSYIMAHCMGRVGNNGLQWNGNNGGHHVLSTGTQFERGVLSFFKTGKAAIPRGETFSAKRLYEYSVLESQYGLGEYKRKRMSEHILSLDTELLTKLRGSDVIVKIPSWNRDVEAIQTNTDDQLLFVAKTLTKMIKYAKD